MNNSNIQRTQRWKIKYENLDDSEFKKEEKNTTKSNWNVRFYNDNREYGVVGDK